MVNLKFQSVEGEARRTLSESMGIPEVLFLIPAQYLSRIINEIGDIKQLALHRQILHMRYHHHTQHNPYLEFLCQLLVPDQIILPLLAEGRELRVFGHPIREMIFGEDGEVGAF